MVKSASIEFIYQKHNDDEAERQKRNYEEEEDLDQEEIVSHSFLFPPNQVLALLEEVAGVVHVVQREGGALLEVFELTQDVLVLYHVFLVDLLQLLICIFE